ncbi:MAG: hypothetical protein ACP5N1_05000 [Candidatus Woesearchaeota archaeon]
MATIEKIISNMSSNDYVSFQRELQYALVWHDEGYQAAQMSILGNSDQPAMNGKSDGAFGGESYHRTRRDEVAKSELYHWARIELRKRIPDSRSDVNSTWVGWVAPKTLNEVKEIRAHVHRIFRNKYPIYGVTGGAVQKEDVEKSKAILQQVYGLKGVFLGKEPLVETFLKNYSNLISQ